jgi:hypothetical protein
VARILVRVSGVVAWGGVRHALVQQAVTSNSGEGGGAYRGRAGLYVSMLVLTVQWSGCLGKPAERTVQVLCVCPEFESQ